MLSLTPHVIPEFSKRISGISVEAALYANKILGQAKDDVWGWSLVCAEPTIAYFPALVVGPTFPQTLYEQGTAEFANLYNFSASRLADEWTPVFRYAPTGEAASV